MIEPLTELKVRQFFSIARIPALRLWELPNQYWPRVSLPEYELSEREREREDRDFLRYHRLREASPWWLVKTPAGMIEIGARKKVIVIDWSDTGVEADVTADDVTKTKTMVHAWSDLKALEYLTKLREILVEATRPIGPDNNPWLK